MSNPALDAILPWNQVKNPRIAKAIRSVRAGQANVADLFILVQHITDPNVTAWKRLEDYVRQSISLPLLTGCDSDPDILNNLYGCLRKDLSSQDYHHAIWVLYLAEREKIQILSERFWRQMDRILSNISLTAERDMPYRVHELCDYECDSECLHVGLLASFG